MNVIIWHNPRCSKSRSGLALVEGEGIEPTIVRYLEEPPTAEELDRVLKLLDMAPRDLMRRKEKILDDDLPVIADRYRAFRREHPEPGI